MIAFASLFLGLILGVHEVELVVEGDIAAVVLRLDEQVVATRAQAPWTLACDFGSELHPHKLEALAVSDNGEIVDRAVQWINLPRSRAEAGFVLEGAEPSRPDRARLVWQHIEFSTAEQVSVRFDRKKLSLDAEGIVTLPRYNPDELHTLKASLRFPDGARYQTEINFGARLGFGAEANLTGVPLVTENRPMPSIDDLDGLLGSGEERLDVIGVERSPARIVMVVDSSAAAGLRSLAPFGSSLTTSTTQLQAGERLEFLFPGAHKTHDRNDGSKLFSISQPFSASDGSFAWLLTRVPVPEATPSRRLTDALAVAGVQAAGGSRPRAVVLILGHEESDTSAYTVSEVRRFLEELRVPLLVWWTGHSTSVTISEDRRPLNVETVWGPARDISTVSRLLQAVEDLRSELDAQLIAWVEGIHLPSSIELTEKANKLRLAGS